MCGTEYVPVDLTRETMKEHREKVLARMRTDDLDVLLIYADREHGANFAYLTGFEPRFEEGLLVLHSDGACFLLLGNENLKMSRFSFIEAETIHTPWFSLPNQPMYQAESMDRLLARAGIRDGMRAGCAGWKVFADWHGDHAALLDMPAFIADAVRRNNPNGVVKNAGAIFQDVQDGVRIKRNANEIAHYEFGAGLASSRVLAALNSVAVGKTEMEIAQELTAFGQPITVTTICAAGERFANAVVFPRNKQVRLGDPFSVTLGLRGGLSSRAAYVAETEDDLPEAVRDYVEKVAIPYYRAAVTWYENVGIGVYCSDIYRKIEEALPAGEYGWTLNPGHYTDEDEWSASPFYRESPVRLESGMLLQMDIIPSVSGYGGTGAEDGIAIANRHLREEICREYPAAWRRIEQRRNYMQKYLGIMLKEEILPLSDICGYMRPLLLNHNYAFRRVTAMNDM